ncbi:hypothetical protein ACFFRR_010598 [Megaselia abdita]
MFKSACICLLVVVPCILADNVFKINISPEEAQQYLEKAHQLKGVDALEYSPKIGENPLPETRNANGEFIYQGRKIENPSDYVEEHYQAHQYHGQDGLGKYAYGYKDWNQAKNEVKNENGEVRGTYRYARPDGRHFIAKYWADSQGFHHEDNRPKVELKQIPDSPAVAAAKEEFFRKWREAAAANGVDPNAAPIQSDEGQWVSDGSENVYNHVEPKYEPSDEEKGEPKGFYYEFDYHTPLLRNLQERAELEALQASVKDDE